MKLSSIQLSVGPSSSNEMIDSFTLSHEAVATLKTDCKELRTTVGGSPHVTRRENKGDKTDGTTGQRCMVHVRVVREHLPSAPADTAAGDREKFSHMTP